MKFEGKIIKEINQGTSYCYIYFTDGTSVDLDIKGDAYIEYSYGEEKDAMSESDELKIHSEYHGADGLWHIFMDGEQVHVTKEVYQRDMFIAELKAKIKLMMEGKTCQQS